MQTSHSLFRAGATSVLLRSGLNMIQQALTIYSEDLRLILSNRRFGAMFELPDQLTEPGASFEETMRFLAGRGEYGPVGDIETFVSTRLIQARAFEPHYMERQRPNGKWISVEGGPLRQGGWITVYTDITQIKQQEALLRARSDELSETLLDRSEELARTNRALEATISRLHETQQHLEVAEARVRLAAETTPAHIARMNLDQIYTYSNRRLQVQAANGVTDIIGHSVREVLGERVYGIISPALTSALEGTAKVVEFQRDDGRQIQVTFTPDTDAGQRVRGVYVLSMDISADHSTAEPTAKPTAVFDGWTAFLDRLELVATDGRSLFLSTAECALLRVFLEHPKRLITRDDILARLEENTGSKRGLDVRISRLRAKLGEDPKTPGLIKTIYGSGYIFASEVAWV